MGGHLQKGDKSLVFLIMNWKLYVMPLKCFLLNTYDAIFSVKLWMLVVCFIIKSSIIISISIPNHPKILFFLCIVLFHSCYFPLAAKGIITYLWLYCLAIPLLDIWIHTEVYSLQQWWFSANESWDWNSKNPEASVLRIKTVN